MRLDIAPNSIPWSRMGQSARIFDLDLQEATDLPIENVPVPDTQDPLSPSPSPYTSICKHCNWTAFPASHPDLGLPGPEVRKQHNRSEWHRLNVALQTKVPALPSISLSEYQALCKDHLPAPESISPTDYLLDIVVQDQEPEEPAPLQTNSPYSIVRSADNVEQIYRCWRVALAARGVNNWLLMLNGGGYFAAGLFCRSEGNYACPPAFHKATHKYTVRKGQGTSQAAMDSRKKCHSIGSALRRRNEIALQDQIQALFGTWKSQKRLDEDSLIVFCNRTVTNKTLVKSVFGEHVLIESIPFTTYRATSAEICRCFESLVQLLPCPKLGLDTHQ